jgi:hypothetical protein
MTTRSPEFRVGADVYRRDEEPAVPSPLEFEPCEEYTTFRAEHSLRGDDIVVHFFRTEEHPSEAYWKETFAAALDETAQAHYGAFPRVRAHLSRIPSEAGEAACERREAPWVVDSWWLEARGFAGVGQPKKKLAAFYEALDKALEKRIAS